MGRKALDAEEIFADFVDREGWTKRRQIDILLGLVASLDLEGELEAYLEQECATEEEDDEDSEDPGSFDMGFD